MPSRPRSTPSSPPTRASRAICRPSRCPRWWSPVTRTSSPRAETPKSSPTASPARSSWSSRARPTGLRSSTRRRSTASCSSSSAVPSGRGRRFAPSPDARHHRFMLVVVVGAGLAGLTAARALVAAGHDVMVLERGRSPGGRMATRRIGAATVDHGAQFFTVRSDEFGAMVNAWVTDGGVTEWCRRVAGRPDPFPRYRAIGGMNAVPRHLARGLDVRCQRLAFMLRKRPRSWVVIDDAAVEYEADAVVITTPVPQAYSFLIAGELDAPDALRELSYERTLALLVVLDGPSAVPEPGGVQDADATFSFVADNACKGVSAVPA